MNNFLKNFSSLLGLDKDESDVFVCLIQNGILTPLELSRKTGIDRSKVYRRLEDLSLRGLVEEIVDQKRKKFKVVETGRLEQYVKDKEKEINSLNKLFPLVSTVINKRTGLDQPGTKVLFYRGKEGIKQLIWNNLRAKKVVLGYSYILIREVVGEEFEKKWRDEFVRRKLVLKDIYSDIFVSNLSRSSNIVFPSANFTSKYIPSNKLSINHYIDIYNNVVAYFDYHEDQIFGVEIYNQKIADLQKQIFRILWQISENPPRSAQKYYK